MTTEWEKTIAGAVVALIIIPLAIAVSRGLGRRVVNALNRLCGVDLSNRNAGRAAVLMLGLAVLIWGVATGEISEPHSVVVFDAFLCLGAFLCTFLVPNITGVLPKKQPIWLQRAKQFAAGLFVLLMGLVIIAGFPYSLWRAWQGRSDAIVALSLWTLISIAVPSLVPMMIRGFVCVAWADIRDSLAADYPPTRIRDRQQIATGQNRDLDF